MTVDLHVHSTASDGIYSPSEIIIMSKELNLKAISITDHDTIAGINEGIKTAAHFNVEFIPGIELSTVYEEKEIHILGYYIDIDNLALSEILNELAHSRENRAKKIVEKLQELNIKINYSEVLEIAGTGVIGRPHIAQALIKSKYVESLEEAFDKYLSYGRSAYVPRYKLSPEDAIKLIHQVGGIAVLAHPGTSLDDETINYLITLQIDGIEVWHPQHSEESVIWYSRIAEENKLLITGGTDFHGLSSTGENILGKLNVPYSVVTKMKNKLYKT